MKLKNKQTKQQINKQMDKEFYKYSIKQANKQTNKQTMEQRCIETSKKTYKQQRVPKTLPLLDSVPGKVNIYGERSFVGFQADPVLQ